MNQDQVLKLTLILVGSFSAVLGLGTGFVLWKVRERVRVHRSVRNIVAGVQNQLPFTQQHR